MKFSRRDFIHAGCTVTAVSLVPKEADAFWHGLAAAPAFAPTQRNVINMNFAGSDSYPTILLNRFKAVGPNLNGASPFDGFSLGPFMQNIDQNGYINVAGRTGGGAVRGGATFPGNNDSGPYVCTWDGDGGIALDTTVGTTTGVYSETNTGAAGNYTRLLNGSWINAVGKTAYVTFTTSWNSGVGVTTAVGAGYTFTNNGTAVSISSISWTGGLVTVTTSAHGRTIGQVLSLTLTGTSNVALNGTFKSTITGTTTFTFPLAGSGSATGGTMTAFVTNVRIYRLADETRLLAGNHYRTAWLNSMALLNPGAIRFMNWNNVNQPTENVMRFTDRNLPSYANWAGPNSGQNFTIGPAYGYGTGNMQYQLAAITTGTQSNPNTTPSGTTTNQIHGQAVQFQLGTDASMGGGPQIAVTNITTGSNPSTVTAPSHGRSTGDTVWLTKTGTSLINTALVITVVDANNFTVAVNASGTFTAGGYFMMSITSNTVSSITKASTAVVTTSSNHNYTTGDTVIHQMTTGMVLLNNFPVVVTVTGATTYTIPVNTTAYPTFTSATTYQFVTLQVGSQSAYPIGWFGNAPFTSFSGSTFQMARGGYKSATFDATLCTQSDGAGNNVMGMWIMNQSSSISTPVGWVAEVPIEACVQLVNELNAYNLATYGNSKKTSCWMCTGMASINSYDVNQTPGTISSACVAANMVDVCVNPSSTLRAAGYSALSTGTKLLIEFSNELWNTNSGPNIYMRQRSSARYNDGTNDFANTQMLRATTQALDIATAFPTQIGMDKQIIRVLGIPPNGGNAAISSTPYQLWLGGSFTTPYATDPVVTGNSLGFPAAYHEMMAVAPYVNPSNSYFNNNATGTFTFFDDLAMYAGTDNSGTLSMTGGTGGVASTTLVITAVGAGTPVVNQPLVGSGITSPNTIITAVSGVSPNYTLTLSQAATVTNGTTITAPANGGGNYIGAANQTQALTNFVSNPSNANCVLNSTSVGISYFETFYAVISAWLATGKYIGGYEGGPNWQTAVGASVGASGHTQTLTSSGSAFMVACYDCSQLGTVWSGFLDYVASLPNTCGSAAYTINSNNLTSRQWTYCADPWASGVEGQALLNNPTWAAMSTRNQALSI